MPDLRGTGTAEARWRRWDGLCPVRRLDVVPNHVVIAAPHPDDEVLGAGGTLARWARAGVPITIVAVTDGERSHPSSSTWSAARLAWHRRAESEAAWSLLGLAGSRVVRLSVRDGAVDRKESEIGAALRELCTPESLCLATWAGDGHPDHEAVGRASRSAAEAVGAEFVCYPIWMWHWASPGDARVPWDRARSVTLETELARAKRSAAAEFVTQTQPLSQDPADQPVLPRGVLARLLREFEVFFV